MQLDVGMEPTFRFEHMICICKEMGIVKFEILWKFTCRVEYFTRYELLSSLKFVTDRQTDRLTDGQTDGKRRMWAHRAIRTGGLKKVSTLPVEFCLPIALTPSPV